MINAGGAAGAAAGAAAGEGAAAAAGAGSGEPEQQADEQDEDDDNDGDDDDVPPTTAVPSAPLSCRATQVRTGRRGWSYKSDERSNDGSRRSDPTCG